MTAGLDSVSWPSSTGATLGAFGVYAGGPSSSNRLSIKSRITCILFSARSSHTLLRPEIPIRKSTCCIPFKCFLGIIPDRLACEHLA